MPHDLGDPSVGARAGGYQGAFAAALLDPAAAAPAGVSAGAGAAVDRRFAVYRNNVVASLIAALGEAYPTVKRLVGAGFFDAMAGLFVRAHPPTSPLMMFYGAAFPDWLAGFEPAAPAPYLPDLARLERARRESYHAADAAPLSGVEFQRAVAGLSPEAMAALRFDLHPSLRALRSAYPILSIWSDAGGQPCTVQAAAQTVMVVRPASQVTLALIPSGGAAFIAALGAGQPLGAAAEAGAAAAPGFDLGRALAQMTVAGALSGVRAAPQPGEPTQ